MRSTSGESNFTFVCDSNFGSLCLTEITAVKAEESASEAEQHIIPTADTSTVEPGIAVKADRLYKASAVTGSEVYIYVLLEHKSAPDPEVGVQLLGYLAEIWRRLDRQRLEQGGAVGSDRPPIVPLVIYHGAREWNVPLSFGETVAADPALKPYLPDFTYSLLDLGQVADDQLSSQRVARGGLRVLKYSHRPDGQGAAVLAAVDDLLGSGILVSAFIYINWE